MKVYEKKIEPLKLLLTKYNFQIDEIRKIFTGRIYTAVLLNSGNIGVSANLNYKINPEKKNYLNISLQNFSHRVVLNAYFNALLNYSNNCEDHADIFNLIDFKKYDNIVMLGFFKPVVEIFNKKNIPISVFDLINNDPVLIPITKQKKYLKKADALILTSTSIVNKTFLKSIMTTKKICDIFMLGPSSIMSEELLNYKNIKMIFGATFEKGDNRILRIIQEDGGTRKFLKFGKKRVLKKNK